MIIETVIPITVFAIVHAIKSTDTIPKKFLPLISLLIGGIIGGLFMFYGKMDFYVVFSGLMATGLYESGKAIGKNFNQ